MERIIVKANDILERSDVVILTSINKDGYPRPVPLSKISNDSDGIWFSTGKDSVKVKDFSINNKAGVCFYEGDNSVALEGIAEIVTDVKMKKKYWKDWFINYFPKGIEDENYTLLKFVGKHATIWIDGEFVHTDI